MCNHTVVITQTQNQTRGDARTSRSHPEVARGSVEAMHRQVGALSFAGHGLARSGLLLAAG
jgi:hypothetical protein